MKQRVTESFSILRTTAIGGIFFLLPLVVIGALLGQLFQVVWAVALSAHTYLPFHTVGGYSLLFLIVLLMILLVCFLAGIVARRALARRFTEKVEKYLLMLFPRYAIFKEQLTGNIGGEVLQNQLKPVLVLVPEGQRIAMEIERGRAMGDNWVTVFFPGSPDPWSGSVAIVSVSRVQTLEVPFTEALATVEQLGRGSLRVLNLSSESSKVL